MQRRTWIFCVLCALALTAGFAAAQQTGSGPSPEEQAMMAAAAPGEQHKHLAHFVGSWNTKITMWMAPGQPPVESVGTAESHWILGGRFVESTYKGDFMGMPFEGHGLDGYDNLAKQYVGSWVDNVGTGIMHSKGSFSPDGKVITAESEMIDAMSGQKIKMRSATTAVDANSYRMEMFTVDGTGGQVKVMELVATRK